MRRWSATAPRSASGACRCASTSRERTGSSPWVHTWDNGAVNPRTVVILGSTGSVGTQALELIGRDRDLSAGGDNVALLAEQALEFGVEVVAVAKATVAQDLQLAFYAEAQRKG